MNYKKKQMLVNELLTIVRDFYPKISQLPPTTATTSGNYFRMNLPELKYSPSLVDGIELIINADYSLNRPCNIAISSKDLDLSKTTEQVNKHIKESANKLQIDKAKTNVLFSEIGKLKSAEPITIETLQAIVENSNKVEYRLNPSALYHDLEEAAKKIEEQKKTDFYIKMAQDMKSRLKKLKPLRRVKEFQGPLQNLGVIATLLTYQNKK